MSTLSPTINLERDFFPTDVAEQAAAEIRHLLYKNSSAFRLLVSDHRPATQGRANLMALKIDTTYKEWLLAKVAPTFVSVIDGVIANGEESLAVGPVCCTVNYAKPGERVPEHRDVGNESYDRLATVVCISGIGRTIFRDPRTGEVTDIVDSQAGDVFTFINPAARAERWPHSAINTGVSDRITVGWQLPLAQALL